MSVAPPFKSSLEREPWAAGSHRADLAMQDLKRALELSDAIDRIGNKQRISKTEMLEL